jgi:heme/copper-type cytochrome/quinol oxidase subunit 4
LNTSEDGNFSEKRLLLFTAIVLIVLFVGSLWLQNWRVSLGVLLGGTLSFLNVYWLKLSLKNLFNKTPKSEMISQFNSSFYILRYVIIATIVAFMATLRLVSVAATIIGLLSFAFAILLEAIVQLYFVIVNREES